MRGRLLSVALLSWMMAPNSLDAVQSQEPLPGMTVGILLFEGVQIIDFTGPYEVFGQAGMEVWTASVDGKSVTTHMGLQIRPTYALADAPQADILVLPGGNVPHVLSRDDPRRSWVQERAAGAQSVLSVCNGVFYLLRGVNVGGRRPLRPAGWPGRCWPSAS